MKRRKFIEQTSMGLGAVASVKLDKMNLSAYQPFASIEEENDNILVIVQLFGGNDGINTITPYEWAPYYEQLRPRLHIPENDVTIISKEKGCAMHPSLLEGVNGGMHGMHTNGKLSIIQGVGYDNPNFSHFRSNDIWNAGYVPPNDSQPLYTGWMGRYFDRYPDSDYPDNPYCIHVGSNPALAFQGQNTEKATLVTDPDVLFEQGKNVESEAIDSGYQSYFDEEFDFVNATSIQINNYSKVIKQAFDNGKNIEEYETNSLSNQLKLVARLIDGGLKSKVYFVELSGFDTHANQGALEGLHTRLLRETSQAISAFQSDIEQLGHSKRVLGITTSEFGRRPYENGSYGTDHGTANVQFAFGDAVNGELIGGNIAFLQFRDSTNLTFRYDFRSVYYEVLTTWFGAEKEFVQNLLGKAVPIVNNKGFLTETIPDPSLPQEQLISEQPGAFVGGSENPLNVTEQDTFEVFPNPVVNNQTTLKMVLQLSNNVEVYQQHISGLQYGLVGRGSFFKGNSVLPLTLKGGPGVYILRIKKLNRTYYIRVLKI